MNNPFDYTPDSECEEAFKKLLSKIESLKSSPNPDDVNFCRELEDGKMLGVLISEDHDGKRHIEYAFSGQLGVGGFLHEGFVEPVFDYLKPDGHFKTHEASISRLNSEIEHYEMGELRRIRDEYEEAKKDADSQIAQLKDKYKLSKLKREEERKRGSVNPERMSEMILQSQFEKAELRRLKNRMNLLLGPLHEKLEAAEKHLSALKKRRHDESEALQKWLFTNFRVLNARGESRSLSDIFKETTFGVPPSGAGECCAPKLLQSAYIKGWEPVSIAEYWYGKSKEGEVRIHGRHYPACRGKCLPVLSWMLQGLDVRPPLDEEPESMLSAEPDIVFENRMFCVVEKPSGMLSVPGKGRSISVEQWLQKKYGPEQRVKVAHRLDQDTSGLLIATFGEENFKVMQSLFARRVVAKTYVADLEGDFESRGLPKSGQIDIPLSPDRLDRPRQRVNFENGKASRTEYKFVEAQNGRSRIIFHPLTGRTHQLRVHAASAEGLGMPIVGDRLYGRNTCDRTERLHLHAHKIEFTFPVDGRTYIFESPVPF